MVEYCIIVILSAAVLYFAAKFLLIKKQLQSVGKQLESRESRLISVELIDCDVEKLAAEINCLIDEIQQIRIESDRNAEALKLSVADISHDMRTPLTSVIGYLQLAVKECQEESVRVTIDIALERAIYCNKLINEFFEISIIETKGLNPLMEKVDIAGLLCEQILANAPDFQKRKIVPYFAEADIPVFVWADKNLLTRMIQNLIVNSMKYASGDVIFTVTDSGEEVMMKIMNPTYENHIDTEHIFDKFYREEKSRHTGGTGLGLYICKRFAEIMGGRLDAEFYADERKFVMKLFVKRYREEQQGDSCGDSHL